MKKYISFLIIALSLNSCVSSKVYKELEGKYSGLKTDYDQLTVYNETLENNRKELENNFEVLKDEKYSLQSTLENLATTRDSLRSRLSSLQTDFILLKKNSSETIAQNIQKNTELLATLNEKEEALALENERLSELEKTIQERSAKIQELENLIAAKDKAMLDLKNALSKALIDFEGKGLTVEQRNGKVYVSMENKLLFKSGSWSVEKKGKLAIDQLGEVLAMNSDIAILIEGHTDNIPYTGNATLNGNWDLSTKRATAIVKLLQKNKKIIAENLTAAGRGEFIPIASNTTAEGRAINRRIEIILSPKLDEVSKLLNLN